MMSEQKIRVLTLHPDSKKPNMTSVSPSLENLQRYVGGYIEVAKIAKDLVVICDEEGRLKGKPFCCNILGVNFVGDIIIAGMKGAEFADIPISYAEAKRYFPQLWKEERL